MTSSPGGIPSFQFILYLPCSASICRIRCRLLLQFPFADGHFPDQTGKSLSVSIAAVGNSQNGPPSAKGREHLQPYSPASPAARAAAKVHEDGVECMFVDFLTSSCANMRV